jgi:predicted nucleic acid-binding protein
MLRALVDTGVWYAIFDPSDSHASRADELAGILDVCEVVLPWPTLYETLKTRFVRNSRALLRFEEYLRSHRLQFLDDALYRDRAMKLAFSSSLRGNRPLGMVDCLIRLLIEDVNVKVDCLATLNRRDFFDVCKKRGVEILDGG